MSSSSMTPPPSCLSIQEDGLLKTSLAFVVLRNRFKNEESSREHPVLVSPPPFFRGGDLLLTQTSVSADVNHLECMFQVAVSTARASYKQYDGLVLYQHENMQTTTTPSSQSNSSSLNGLLLHLAVQLRAASRHSCDPLSELIKSSLTVLLTATRENILATCTVWHGILARDCCLGSMLTTAIGEVLQALDGDALDSLKDNTILHDQPSIVPDVSVTSLVAVNLIHLLEEITRMRLESRGVLSSHVVLQELQNALGDSLCLPVPIRDLAYSFYQHNAKKKQQLLTSGAKLMMRQCLWDLIQKVSNYNNP